MLRSACLSVMIAGLGLGCAGSRNETGTLVNREGTLLKWSHEPAKSEEEKPDEPAMPEVKDRRTEEPLQSDRPDFTEASSTVGRGRVQLEAGYTYSRDKSNGLTTQSHSYPEALLRIGLFADWFELRIGQNAGESFSETFGINGGEDLYLGVKLALTEQAGILPETALVIQATVPTGDSQFTSGVTQPGVNYLFGWDVVPDCLTFAGSLQANAARDDLSHGYVEVAQSLTIGYDLTKKLGAYTEWFAFYPAGAIAPATLPEHYFNGGFIYRVTPNLQLDLRAGLGLNDAADDFFAGSGFCIRY